MAGAFQSGFQMGQTAYQQMLDNRDREERRKREAEKWERDRALLDMDIKDRQELAARQAQIDDQLARIRNPNIGNYQFQPQSGIGLSLPAEGAAPAVGLRLPVADAAPAVGLRGGNAAAAPPGGYTNNPDLTPAQIESVLANVAGLQRDVGSLRTSMANRRAFEENDIIAQAMKAYQGSPEQIGQAIQYVNTTSPTITLGKPDKDGFVQMSIVQPTGDSAFAKLNKADQATIFAAMQLMERNPARALEMIGKVNKDLAASVAAENQLFTGVVGANNTMAGQRGTLGATRARDANTAAYQMGRLEVDRQNAQAQAKQTSALAEHYARPDPRFVKEFVDKDGNVRLLNVLNMPRGPNGEYVVPEGLKPVRTTTSLTPEQRVELAQNLMGGPDPFRPGETINDPARAKEVADMLYPPAGGTAAMTPAQMIAAAYVKGRQGQQQPTPQPTSDSVDPAAPRSDREISLVEGAARLGFRPVARTNRVWGIPVRDGGDIIFEDAHGNRVTGDQVLREVRGKIR